jgi:hypothetical protein
LTAYANVESFTVLELSRLFIEFIVNPTFREGGGAFLAGSAAGCVNPAVKLGIYFKVGI